MTAEEHIGAVADRVVECAKRVSPRNLARAEYQLREAISDARETIGEKETKRIVSEEMK